MLEHRERKSASIKRSLLILFLCLTALIMRLVFFVGPTTDQDLIQGDRILRSAALIKSAPQGYLAAIQEMRLRIGGFRNLVQYFPSVIFNVFFGASPYSILVLPLILSLVNIWLLYSITRVLFTDKAAMLAGLMWVFFPLDIYFAGTSLTVIPSILFLLLSVYSILIASYQKDAKGYWLLGLAVGGQLLTEPWLLIPTIVLLVQSLPIWKKTSNRSMFGLVLVLVFALIAAATGVFLDFYSLLLTQGEFVIWLPLFIVASVIVLAKKVENSSLLFTWTSAILATMLAENTVNAQTNSMSLSEYGVFLLALSVPLVIIAGQYLSTLLHERTTRKWVGVLSISGVLGAWLAVIGAQKFLPSVETIGLHSLFVFYAILIGVAFALILSSPIFVRGKPGLWKLGAEFILLATMLLGSTYSTWDRARQVDGRFTAAQQALSLISNRFRSPVFSASPTTKNLLTIVRDFDIPSTLSEISLIPDGSEDMLEGYVVSFDDEIANVPPTWLKLGDFGKLGSSRMTVYEMMPVEKARELFDAHALGNGLLTPEKNLSVYEIGVKAGFFCEAYQAWANAQKGASDRISFIPTVTDSDCFDIGDSLVTVEDLTNRENQDGYITWSGGSNQPLGIIFKQISAPVFDMRSMSVNVLLRPDSFYLYSVELLSPVPSATLFWKEDSAQDYLELRGYPDWIQKSILIRTPSWDGNAIMVSFSPVLFSHLGDVGIRDFVIAPVIQINE